MIAILAVVAIYFVIDSGFFSSGDAAADIEELADAAMSKNDLDLEYLLTYHDAKPLNMFGLNYSWEKDPFYYVPKGGEAGIEEKDIWEKDSDRYPALILTGISQNGNTGYAMISTRVSRGDDTTYVASIVKEGEMVGGFKVDKIAFDYVILRQGTTTGRLKLNP